MKIHMRNIVAGAISRGLIDGYLATKTKLQTTSTEEEELRLLEEIQSRIWDELEDVVDFTDDENDVPEKTPVGFGPPTEPLADAISDRTIIPDSDEDVESERLRTLRNQLRRSLRRCRR